MLYQNVHIFARWLRVIDAATVSLTAMLVWFLGVRWGLWNADTSGRMLLFAGGLVASFVVIAFRLRIYRARRTDRVARELIALLWVAICATGISCLIVEVATAGLPGTVYGITALAGTTALLGARLSIRALLRRLRRGGKDHRTWLIIGRNRRSADIACEILANTHFGIRIARVIDVPATNGDSERLARFAGEPLCGLDQVELSNIEGVREILAADVIDEVVVSLPVRSHYDEIERALQLCGEAGISVRFPPQTFDGTGIKSQVVRVGDVPLVTHYSGPSSHGSLAAKRLIDIVAASTGMLLLLPLHLTIATAIRLTSRGPIFFHQTRIGLHGRQFQMYKYRTMAHDAASQRTVLSNRNERDGPAFKIRRDPRVTSVGRLLRRYHLDELPQLWNVLAGEMSLVGPRPLPPQEAHGEEWWQRRRLSMQPGLTCLWQVKGDHRIPFREWMELDLEYIDRWSLRLDLRLIVATVVTVARGSGW